jgi:hypothetical protein
MDAGLAWKYSIWGGGGIVASGSGVFVAVGVGVGVGVLVGTSGSGVGVDVAGVTSAALLTAVTDTLATLLVLPLAVRATAETVYSPAPPKVHTLLTVSIDVPFGSGLVSVATKPSSTLNSRRTMSLAPLAVAWRMISLPTTIWAPSAGDWITT